MRDFNIPVDLIRHSNMNDDQLKQAVIQLGLDYSLMTQWTSFLAVSKQVVNTNPSANKDSAVPLPIPAGVPASAYGEQPAPVNSVVMPASTNNTVVAFAGSSAPEPESIYGLLLLSLMMGGFWWFRVARN